MYSNPSNESERLEAYVQAIIETECHFRPFDKRLIEYIRIVTLYFLGRKLDLVTVGVAQISFFYWVEKYSESFWLTVFRTFLYKNNASMVKYIVSKYNVPIDEEAFLKFYNGRPSKAYVEVFRKKLRANI